MKNDLKTDLTTCKFVHDTTLFQICQGQDNGLQDAAFRIESWSKGNQMRLNALEIKAMVIFFRKAARLRDPITIDNCIIEQYDNDVRFFISSDLT